MSGNFSLRHLSVFTTLSVLASLLFTSGATAEPCDPNTSTWVPEQSYTQGSVVFYNEHWYEARDLSIGGEPGITFLWKALNKVPDCDIKATEKREKGAPKVAAPGSGTNNQPESGNQGNNNSEITPKLCVTPEPWRFLHQYNADELASHGSKVWQAIRPSKGEMPGTGEPSSWQLVPDHCSLKLNSSFGN